MPQRSNFPVLLTHIFSGPYCTFFVMAGVFAVATKFNLRPGDYTQVWQAGGLAATAFLPLRSHSATYVTILSLCS